MIIACDFDSVVNDLHVAIIHAVNNTFGTKYSQDSWTEWDFWNNEPPEILEYVWGDLFMRDNFTLGVPPTKDAITSLRRLMNNHRVYILTDRHPHHQQTVEDWFAQYALYPEVILTDRYDNSKAKVAKKLKAHVAIDDAPHNVLQYAEVVQRVLCYDRPWNRAIDAPYNVERVPSWLAILETI